MRKINTLLSENSSDSQFSQLAKQANTHLNLRQFWEAIAPRILSQSSFAGNLNNGQLIIYASNASVAAKIKLTSPSLLTQLQNLALSDPFYRECKVTSITVKVQVKSQPKSTVKTPRKLSSRAAAGLINLADQLGDNLLSAKLKQLASKQ
jgi:hypothetical protein